MSIRVPLGNDLSRFASNQLYTESITLYLYQERLVIQTYKCPGMILAYRSKVFEKLISMGEREIVLETALFGSSDHSGISDVIKILHGGQVELTEDNFAAVWKFSAKFELRTVFQECFDWVQDRLAVENFISWFPLAKQIDGCSSWSGGQVNIVMKLFFQQNVNKVINQMALAVETLDLDPNLILLACSSTKSAYTKIFHVLIQWAQRSDKNKLFILNHSPFKTICPDKSSLDKLMKVLQDGRVSLEQVTSGIRNIQLDCCEEESKSVTVISLIEDGFDLKKELKELEGTTEEPKTEAYYSHFDMIPVVKYLSGDVKTYSFEDLEVAKYNQGLSSYNFVETCLAWLASSQKNQRSTLYLYKASTVYQLCDKVYELCNLEQEKSVNYSYFLRVLHQLDHMYGFHRTVTPTRWQWPKDKRDDDRVLPVSKNDLAMLGRGGPIVFDITRMGIGDPRLCKKLKCYRNYSGPQVMAIQLNPTPPLLKPQDEVDPNFVFRFGHVHTGFIEHCFGVTRTCSGKEEIVSMLTNTRDEFVERMSNRREAFIVFALISKCWGCSDKRMCAYRHD